MIEPWTEREKELEAKGAIYPHYDAWMEWMDRRLSDEECIFNPRTLRGCVCGSCVLADWWDSAEPLFKANLYGFFNLLMQEVEKKNEI